MFTNETSNPLTKKRFFGGFFSRDNEHKEEKEAQSTELVLKARTAYQTVPDELTDTFTSELFVEPVLTKHGHVFEKQSLLTWLQLHSECPKTKNPLTLLDLECPTAADIAIHKHINSIIQDYTTKRASFLQLITNGKVTEDDIIAYQKITTQAVEDFTEATQSMFDAEIQSQLRISYKISCFPPTIESFDNFCDQVLVLSDGYEWISKLCASSYTEYKKITDDLWKLNEKLIQLNIAIESEPSNQLRTTISQLHDEYQRILANMQSIKQSQIYSRRVDEFHEGSYLFPDENSSFLEYTSLDSDTLEIKPTSTVNYKRFTVNYKRFVGDSTPALDAPKDETPVENNINDAVSQSPQCSCSLFLKIISAVALANGILLLIVLHTPVGFAAGITSLCVGGLTLFAGSREKKHDVLPNAPAPAHLVSP